ncbi:MAG: carboxylating nicotinate-nucleotide diphosphorylase [Dehalococcoidia bacterium]|nr:carboxylating nicotinate-nucleotide diphosphorylase [Dehalococcoidia bacterium]
MTTPRGSERSPQSPALPAGHPAHEVIAAIVVAALAEDRVAYDITTQASIPPDQPGEATLLYKEAGVVCGVEVVREVMRQMSPDLVLDARVAEGAWVESGTVAAEISGPLAPMLSGERVALNLLQRMSGTATMARRYADEAARGGEVRVVDTRKTTPGLRALERYAVRLGGGYNHRNTLEDGVLIKDNHIEAAARRGVSPADLIAEVRARVSHLVRIEVEADTPHMARAAAMGGADAVLLDNMPPDMMRAIVAELRARPATRHVLFEASGGIRIDTIAAVAGTGVDLISVGALTHSAPALDISLDVRPA